MVTNQRHPSEPAALLDQGLLTHLHGEYMPQLLSFRLKNVRRVSRSTLDPPSLTGVRRAMASVLGAPVEDDADLLARLVRLLEIQEDVQVLDDTTRITAVVVEAGLVLCHGDQPVTHAGELAEIANSILSLKKAGITVTSKRVGRVLRSLRLKLHRDNRGWSFALSTEVRREFHRIGQSLNVPFLTSAEVEPCEFCQELRMAASEGGGVHVVYVVYV